MTDAAEVVATDEQKLLDHAREYSFRRRMDQLDFTGPILDRRRGRSGHSLALRRLGAVGAEHRQDPVFVLGNETLCDLELP